MTRKKSMLALLLAATLCAFCCCGTNGGTVPSKPEQSETTGISEETESIEYTWNYIVSHSDWKEFEACYSEQIETTKELLKQTLVSADLGEDVEKDTLAGDYLDSLKHTYIHLGIPFPEMVKAELVPFPETPEGGVPDRNNPGFRRTLPPHSLDFAIMLTSAEGDEWMVALCSAYVPHDWVIYKNGEFVCITEIRL